MKKETLAFAKKNGVFALEMEQERMKRWAISIVPNIPLKFDPYPETPHAKKRKIDLS